MIPPAPGYWLTTLRHNVDHNLGVRSALWFRLGPEVAPARSRRLPRTDRRHSSRWHPRATAQDRSDCQQAATESCAYRLCHPNVVPVETAEPSDWCDAPDCLRGAMERRILVECKMRAHPIVQQHSRTPMGRYSVSSCTPGIRGLHTASPFMRRSASLTTLFSAAR